MTAGHCLFDVLGNPPAVEPLPSNSLYIQFGEVTDGQDDEEFFIGVDYCEPHPDMEMDVFKNVTGPDLAYCILTEDPPVPVPVVSPMVPTGCARDWLSKAMRGVAPDRPLAIATGMGCEDPPACEESGTKRFTGVEILPTFGGKKFGIRRFLDDEGAPQDVGLHGGDSGGPLYVKLPDHTWRLIGVNQTSAFNGISDVQSVPPYIGWVEHSSGADITPCHTRVPGTSDYIFAGGCENVLPLNPDMEEDWMDGCAVSLGGPSDAAVDECAEWPVGPALTFLAPSL